MPAVGVIERKRCSLFIMFNGQIQIDAWNTPQLLIGLWILAHVLVEIFLGVAHRSDLLGILVRDLHVEFLFE
jgi:hypothetical protein